MEGSTDNSGLIRSPITVILGHVDSGKTSLLDKVRGTAVQSRESGGITQHIGASFFPIDTVQALCGELLKGMNKEKLDLPGILIIDTPGHASFMNLRQRGASVANFAILVVDVRRGVQPQTIESLRILANSRTPFLIAANKIDRLPGWRTNTKIPLIQNIKKQSKGTLSALDEIIYEIMGELSHFNLEVERFDKIKDFRKHIAIIPTSAVTGEGIPEMFLVLSVLAEQFLRSQLALSLGKGKGVVLEVKKEVGLGTTLDVILYDGIIRRNSMIVVAGKNEPIVTNVRALLLPKDLDEIRDPRNRFNNTSKAVAAIGIKISAPNLDDAIAGSTLYVVDDQDKEQAILEIKDELSKILVETDEAGVIVKADALGSLEALVGFLRDQNIKIRYAGIGIINKKDVVQASLAKEENELFGVILSFRVNILPEASEEATKCDIKILSSDIIYHLNEQYDEFQYEVQQKLEERALDGLMRPAKIKVLSYCFRQSKPCIIGVEVLSGVLQTQVDLINRDNKKVGKLTQIQEKQDSLSEAKVGLQVAVSIKGPTFGRQVKEGDELWTDLPESHARRINRDKLLSGSELDALSELIEIKRKYGSNKFWGM